MGSEEYSHVMYGRGLSDSQGVESEWSLLCACLTTGKNRRVYVLALAGII
jgi:hypothetical protein